MAVFNIFSRNLIYCTEPLIYSFKMAKKNTILVKLTSTGVRKDGKPTGTYFVKKRNPKKQTEKLQARKFDPLAVDPNNPGKVGVHVNFVEKKMPSHSA